MDIIAKENRDHELHNEFCLYMPVIINAQYIGDFSDDKKALEEALKSYPNANGCKNCCSTCHIQHEVE
ncbi:hypothetical protein [uncultured Flavobacterium sp.]|uniref:hypothetical protein n=1 Tax=uncultured Flavobacterium sp. TaxID=165435 RepID=UPI0030EDA46D